MKDKLKLIVAEIRSGKNLDLYIIIVVSVVFAILGIVGVDNAEKLSAAILATLALLSNALLESRRSQDTLQGISEKLSSEVADLRKATDEPRMSNVLRYEYPDLSEELRRAQSVSILGTSLSSTITRYYPQFECLLETGGSLRFLVSAPTPEITRMMAFRSSSLNNNVDLVAKNVEGNLLRAQALYRPERRTDRIRIRTIPYIPPYGLVIIHTANNISKVHVKVRAFRAPGRMPSFELDSHKDPSWHTFFVEQFEKLWEMSEDLKPA
jgi:hypothetical protein